MGAPGPEQTAWAWLEAIRAQDSERVWRLMDPDFRLVMVQAWISRNPDALGHSTASGLDRDALARELSVEHPTHPLWTHCARVSLREITHACGALERKELRVGTRPRPIGLDLELVRFFPVDELDQDEAGGYYFAPGAQAHVVSVLLYHREAGWLVAGIGDFLGHPGWPPQFEQVVQSDD